MSLLDEVIKDSARDYDWEFTVNETGYQEIGGGGALTEYAVYIEGRGADTDAVDYLKDYGGFYEVYSQGDGNGWIELVVFIRDDGY